MNLLVYVQHRDAKVAYTLQWKLIIYFLKVLLQGQAIPRHDHIRKYLIVFDLVNVLLKELLIIRFQNIALRDDLRNTNEILWKLHARIFPNIL